VKAGECTFWLCTGVCKLLVTGKCKLHHTQPGGQLSELVKLVADIDCGDTCARCYPDIVDLDALASTSSTAPVPPPNTAKTENKRLRKIAPVPEDEDTNDKPANAAPDPSTSDSSSEPPDTADSAVDDDSAANVGSDSSKSERPVVAAKRKPAKRAKHS